MDLPTVNSSALVSFLDSIRGKVRAPHCMMEENRLFLMVNTAAIASCF